ncbi:MAG: DUF2256 domain-containing protein [Burkholderiaceae bacterium]|jgi:hypothetical protein|nr:DUF2256 domain-containing protein [Betaproteobacteria bacterium]
MRSFRGNKATLPSKPCAVCGLTMSWRKRWAKNWEQVLYCSDRCRKAQRGNKPKTQAQSLAKDSN